MRILFISQFTPFSPTGISRQSSIILQYFKKIGIETELYTWEPQITHPFMQDGSAVYPINWIGQRLRADDVIFFYGEHWSVPKGLETLSIPLIWHIPIDTPKLPNDFLKVATKFDLIVPITKFGEQVMREAGIENVWEPIPHTVLLKDTEEALSSKKDGVVNIGTVLRPQRRKNLAGICQCLQQIENAHLDIVSDDEYKEIALRDIFDQFNISYTILNDLNALELSKFYNTIDLYLSTTMAEGFGIPVFEAVFAKKCILATDLPVFRELGLKDKNLIKIKKTISLPNGAEWSLIDETDFLKKYNMLKEQNFPKTDVDISQFSPETIGPKWQELFENLRTILAYN